MFGFDSVASTLEGEVLVSSKMQSAIDKWWKMFENRPPWVSEEDVPTISLPSAIAGVGSIQGSQIKKLATPKCLLP